jgi:hypothetical protein
MILGADEWKLTQGYNKLNDDRENKDLGAQFYMQLRMGSTETTKI